MAYDVPTGEEYPELAVGAVFGEIALLELCAEEVLRNNAAAKKLESIARKRLERSAKLLDDFGPLPPPLV